MSDKQTEEERLNPDTAPDPDEDDLSDLDDMLDEFSSTKIADSKSTSTKPAATQNALSEDVDDEDFAKELQAGMARLLGQLDSNPDMQKQFEDMMKELAATATDDSKSASVPPPSQPQPPASSSTSASTSTSTAKPSTTKKPADASFQDTIRKTMERMQNSGETASAAATSSNEEDMLAQMLREMESGDFGAGSEDEMNKMLMGMMEQLTNKDILYDPMKELHDKFPAWMKDNKDKCSKEDLARYEEQKKVVDEIVARFERPGYSDESNEDREYIVERMQKMQAAGSPPPDLVGDMSAAQDALGDLDAGCPQQ